MSRTQRELKALRQQQREEAAARQRARDRRNLFIIGGVLGTAALAVLIVALALNHAAQVATQNRLPFQTVSGTVGQPVADEGRNYIDFLDGYDQAEITRFYENHVNQGPEQIP